MGANIKIGAESKQFQQEMKQVVQDLKLMSSELGVATTKAELFGTEQDKLGAKSKELQGSLSSQTKIMDLQKQAITSLTTDIAKYKDRNVDLAKSIAEVENKLKDELKANGEGTKQAKELTTELGKLQREYDSNEKAISKAETQTSTYNIKLNDTEKALLEVQKELEDTNKKLENLKFDEASKKLDAFGNKAKDVGQSMTLGLTLPIVGASALAIKSASEMEDELSKVDVVFGKNAESIKAWSETTLDKFGIANLTALQMSSNFGDMGNAMDLPISKSTEMAKTLTGLAGDLASFKGVKVDIAKTALNAVYTGETESLKAMGIVMTQANLQTFALKEGIRKKIDTMTEAEKTTLRYNFVLDKTKNAHGDFVRTGDSSANTMKVFQETLKQVSVTFGEQILPMFTPLLQGLNSFLKFISELPSGIKFVIVVIAGLIAIIGPLLMAIGQASIGLGVLKAGFATTGIVAGTASAGVGLFSGALAILTSPITLTIAGIVALGVVIWAFWDDIKKIPGLAADLSKWLVNKIKEDIKEGTEFVKDTVNGAIDFVTDTIDDGIDFVTGGVKDTYNTIKQVFKDIKDAIMVPVDFVVEHVEKAVNKIQELFAKIKLKLPKIELPHFNLNGSFDLKNMSVPSIGVDWFANGGIMTKATVFGFNGNNAMVGGEVGQEVILPLSELWSNLEKNFNNLEQRLSSKEEITIVNKQDSNKVKDGDTYILNVKMDEIDDIVKLKNMLNSLKQNKRQRA